MQYVRKIILAAAMAAAAMALGASSASAALSISAEPGGAPCSAVSLSGTTGVTGGCLGHETSEGPILLKKHVFGVESSITGCNQEFHSRSSGSGTGYLYEQLLTGATCARQACKSGGEAIPWAANGTEGAALEGNEFLTTTFCVEPVGGGTDENCEIDLPFNDQSDHRYEFGHATEMSAHGISGFRCELEGHWNGETGGSEDGAPETRVEVTHS